MSLIEVMVGLAIALIAMLIVFQVFTASGERSRTTTSGSDAQIAGTLALFQLERDIKQGGMGFGMIPPVSAASPNAGSVAGCAVAAHNSTLATHDFSFVLAPVQIIKDTAHPGAPDQIAVFYGNSAYFVTGRGFDASSNTSKSLTRRDAFNNGDIVLVTNNGTSASTGVCALVEITGYPTPDDGVSVEHVQSAAYLSFPNNVNVAATMNAAATPVAAPGFAYNLGPDPNRNLWQIVGDDPAHPTASPHLLVWNNTLRTDTQQQVTEGIVNLQAEYGVDANATGTAGYGQISAAEWTSVPPTDWTRLLAVRFAILARSQQFEKTAVTNVAPTWANGDGAHTFTMFNVDGTTDSTPGDTNDWRHYRYRVYESTVPLRNMIWGTAL